jgi:hypothetical protein
MDAEGLGDPAEVPYSTFIESFSAFRAEHLGLLNECTHGAGVPIDAVRHLVVAALRRSAALIEGMLVLVDMRNKFCAVPLVRLQLDSAMRVHACRLVAGPTEFVAHILAGGEPRKYKQTPKLDLSDKALHSSLTTLYPLTSDLYSDTNGYVHLSDKHLFGVFDFDQMKLGVVQFTDHDFLPPWDESDVKGTLTTMLWATDVLTEECHSLIKTYPVSGQNEADS